MKAAIIGSGIGGLSTAVRLAKLGLEVHVFEANPFLGGKINSFWQGDFRFDAGPSVFTEPELVEELLLLSPEKIPFAYERLVESCRYFFNDGTKLNLPVGTEKVTESLSSELGENPRQVRSFLKRMEENYKVLNPVFIEVSLHRLRHWNWKNFWHAIARIPGMGLLKTMNRMNVQSFKNPKTVQIFNRLATYNGSSPYKTPGLLNIISHLEMNEGPALPKGGMVAITESVLKAARMLGVQFHTSSKVVEIIQDRKKLKGIRVENKGELDFDVVVSNMDVHFTYEKLLGNKEFAQRRLNHEKSSSAVVFYWGISRKFDQLGVHNILFSANYEEEFRQLFDTKTMCQDPTIYIHITSKIEKEDAPENGENWFVMVNAPIDVGQDWEKEIEILRKNLVSKINRALHTDIEKFIVNESHTEPRIIEAKYFGKQGSIYGNASNHRNAAFYRHPNFSKTIKGLYFAGVTVHPGGGIPLALNSAKIVERCVKEDFSMELIAK